MDYEKIHKIDSQILKIVKSFEKSMLESINPINSQKQKELFFSKLREYKQYTPLFEYNKRKDFTKEKQQLELIKKELGTSIEEKIFFERVNCLLGGLTLIESVNTKDFCHNSKIQYGEPNSREKKLAIEILNRKVSAEEKSLTPENLKTLLEPHLTGTDFTISIEDNMSAKASVHLTEKKLKLNKNQLFSNKDVERYFIHEIQTHIYRYLNGNLQPLKILSLDFGGDELKTEEGLAIYNEQTLGVMSPAQEKIIAGRLYAVDYALKHDFFDTFEEMNKYLPEEDAYTITQRVKRGVTSGKKGAFTKDHCYFSGLLQVQDYVSKGRTIHDLYYGVISTRETGLVKKIHSLVEPKYLPSTQRK
ncbi:MAG: tyrosine/phenylalanine carboxypeptidase domain-containing protein [archaeon]|jgi:uncharacterized protein (TIGR02421 family)